MQKYFTLMLMVGLWITPLLDAQAKSTPMQILKSRQKQAIRALKLKQKYAKESLQGRQVPDALRQQLKHRLKSEEHKLREEQKDERQELKDRQRLLKHGRK